MKNRIIIVQDKTTGEYTIEINGKQRQSHNNVLQKKVIAKEMIDNFLNSNSIIEVGDEFAFNAMRCWRFESGGTTLLLKSYDLKDEFNRCKGDYCSNRMDFINKHPFIKEYEINCITDISKDNKSDYIATDSCIILNLFYDNHKHKIVEFDKLFVEKIVYNILIDSDNSEVHWTGFEEYSEKYGDYIFFYKLKCGEFVLKTTSQIVYEIIDRLVRTYNKSLEKHKSIQLKMEGF